MQEAEVRPGRAAQSVPVVPRRLQERECTDDIGLHEFTGAGNRAVDMTLSGQVHDVIGPETVDRLDNRLAIANVGLDEAVGVTPFDQCQAFKIAGIGQLVEVEDLAAFFGDQISHQSRADETGASRD